MFLGQVHACWYIGKLIQSGVENLFQQEQRINTTCARNLGCNSAQDFYVHLTNELCWTFLINLFCCIVCKRVWIFCVVQVDGAAQCLPRANTSFMLVLCSRQIPANANKLILSYLKMAICKLHLVAFYMVNERKLVDLSVCIHRMTI